MRFIITLLTVFSMMLPCTAQYTLTYHAATINAGCCQHGVDEYKYVNGKVRLIKRTVDKSQ